MPSKASAPKLWTMSPYFDTCSMTTRPELANTRGARWNPPGLAAIYTSEDRDTAIAEGQHAIDMQPLRPTARRYIYELRISARKTLRITPSDLPHLGLSTDDLVASDFTACQRVAAHAAFLDFDALIVPSARADGANVVIFVNELASDATFE